MTQIPIYRAKKRDSEEWVKGYLFKRDEYFFIMVSAYDVYRVDPSTLSISFQNMIDKNGKKIFASLSRGGIGGDIIKSFFSKPFTEGVLKYDGGAFRVNSGLTPNFKMWEVIGIHKG